MTFTTRSTQQPKAATTAADNLPACFFDFNDYFSGMSLRFKLFGSDWESLPAFSWSRTTRVYKNLLQRTLNFIPPLACFLIVTILASFLRDVTRNSLMSWICFGCWDFGAQGKTKSREDIGSDGGAAQCQLTALKGEIHAGTRPKSFTTATRKSSTISSRIRKGLARGAHGTRAEQSKQSSRRKKRWRTYHYDGWGGDCDGDDSFSRYGKWSKRLDAMSTAMPVSSTVGIVFLIT